MDAVVPRNEKRSQKAETLTREQIGEKLKLLYADVVAEPIPDRFLKLIEQLESGSEENEARNPEQLRDSE